ncbi:HAD family hydrolase [Microbispora sp. NPDC049125]|uniref:HAD family hydrolase n=1 Tax=Microbispora sp. NPDC049125 TaxID=3154929 RepID=UPI0034668E3F
MGPSPGGGPVVVCADLDRTLIYSQSALALTGPDADAPRLLCVEVYQGKPLSFVTERAAAGLEALAAGCVLVPATTRTPEQYARVHLPGKAPEYAICANGGHLLVDGVDDPGWAATVRERLASGADLAAVREHLERVLDGRFDARLRIAADLFCYAVLDRAAVPAGWVEDLTGWCAERGWTVSMQGRKLYCLPVMLTKAAAAAEVARRAGAGAMVAAGDSILDIPMLEIADQAIRPAHGELAELGWTSPTTSVTAGRGVAAGEEIVTWLVERAVLGQPVNPDKES